MNTTRRIHLNPQSKGNLGKSFEAEFRTAWLDRLGIAWNGSDLDDRHYTFCVSIRPMPGPLPIRFKNNWTKVSAK